VNRKGWISLCSFISIFLAFGCKQAEQLPNVLLILVDDLGIRDLGCYGQQFIQTPHIDRLAGEGMVWKNAYSSCPVCSPTRASILTGKNPARIHFTGHITAIERHRHPENSSIIPPDDLMYIPYEELTLPEALGKVGYVTGSFGKWHVGGPGYWPEDQGFTVNVGGWTHGSPPAYFYPYERPESSWNSRIPTLEGGEEGEYLPDRLTDEAIRFIRANRAQPFFVYLSYYAVHTPLQAPDNLVKKYESLVKETGIDPVYAAMVDRVDENVGKLISFLDEAGLSEKTLVIFTSDNGGLETVTDNAPFRRGKGHLYDGGIRIPLIMQWTGIIEPGSISQNRTISMDLYPTILNAAGIDTDTIEELDGRSLMEDIQGTTPSRGSDLHWYYPHYGIGMDPGGILVEGDYKLIVHYDPFKVELFNIRTDTSESNDVSAQHPELAEELENKYSKWLTDIDAIMHCENPESENR
jgi:arylsulfatase A-like enzyme